MVKNILKHWYVPEHRKLDEKEKEKLLEVYNIGLNQLPKILREDAAIKELNLEAGDIIEIKRKSVTNKEFIFYRVVVSA